VDVQRLPANFHPFKSSLPSHAIRAQGDRVPASSPSINRLSSLALCALLALAGCDDGTKSREIASVPAGPLVNPVEVYRRPLTGGAAAATSNLNPANPANVSRASGDAALAAASASRDPARPPDSAPPPSKVARQDLDANEWTIVLAAWREADQLDRAEETAVKLRAVAGLEKVFVTTRGPATFVGLGRYADPAAARTDLANVRGAVIGGDRPFADSFLAPPSQRGQAGTRPEMNLLSATEQYGESAKMTLAIAAYEAPPGATKADRDEAQKQAEAAVEILRQQGELAFYHHGQRQSVVTVGLFGDKDIATNTRRESERLATLRKRYPVYLLNGGGIKTKAGGIERMVKTELVQIPQNQ